MFKGNKSKRAIISITIFVILMITYYFLNRQANYIIQIVIDTNPEFFDIGNELFDGYWYIYNKIANIELAGWLYYLCLTIALFMVKDRVIKRKKPNTVIYNNLKYIAFINMLIVFGFYGYHIVQGSKIVFELREYYYLELAQTSIIPIIVIIMSIQLLFIKEEEKEKKKTA